MRMPLLLLLLLLLLLPTAPGPTSRPAAWSGRLLLVLLVVRLFIVEEDREGQPQSSERGQNEQDHRESWISKDSE